MTDLVRRSATVPLRVGVGTKAGEFARKAIGCARIYPLGRRGRCLCITSEQWLVLPLAGL